MIVREPLVYATYYYLRQTPGDGYARREELHTTFIEDTQRMIQSVAGWMAMPAPPVPEIPLWSLDAPETIEPLAKTSELKGPTNASAWVGAYALRNMLLLRVVVVRDGEHDETAWSMLNDALGPAPTTPSWLHTTRYWCGLAPRLPEDLEAGRSLPIQTPFGVLSLGMSKHAHVLVYPDARTESRANHFLRSVAPHLDWYNVQAQHRLEMYLDHAAAATQNQQRALDQIARAMGEWSEGAQGANAATSLQNQIDTLETAYARALDDLTATRSAARELHELATNYHTQLMQSGLWDAAPSVWAAQVGKLNNYEAQIDTDIAHIDTVLRRMETLMGVARMRIMLLHDERARLQTTFIALLGLALLAILIVDTNLVQMGLRLVVLVVIVVAAWFGRRFWLGPSS